MINDDNFIPQATADRSFTFISKEFGEFFHSHYGARLESFFKFASPTQLALKANKPVLRLLDVCYGLGYNTANTVRLRCTVLKDPPLSPLKSRAVSSPKRCKMTSVEGMKTMGANLIEQLRQVKDFRAH